MLFLSVHPIGDTNYQIVAKSKFVSLELKNSRYAAPETERIVVYPRVNLISGTFVNNFTKSRRKTLKTADNGVTKTSINTETKHRLTS